MWPEQSSRIELQAIAVAFFSRSFCLPKVVLFHWPVPGVAVGLARPQPARKVCASVPRFTLHESSFPAKNITDDSLKASC
jgi:hypothetical protein